MTDKWADYKEKFCGCKDASRLNSCKGLANCELPDGHPERQAAQPPEQPVAGELIEVLDEAAEEFELRGLHSLPAYKRVKALHAALSSASKEKP